MSQSPGRMLLPLTSMRRAPGGIGVAARAPAATMRSPSYTTTASSIAGAPLPSMSRPPTSATAPPPSSWRCTAPANQLTASAPARATNCPTSGT